MRLDTARTHNLSPKEPDDLEHFSGPRLLGSFCAEHFARHNDLSAAVLLVPPRGVVVRKPSLIQAM
jgi:hypothetical protein